MKSPHHEHKDQTAELPEIRSLENGAMLELSSGNFVTPAEITLAPNADHPATLIIYRAENLQKNTDGSPCLFVGDKAAGAFHESSCYREQTFDPAAAYVIVSEADVSAAQGGAGFVVLYAGEQITIGREQAGRLSSLRENSYVSREHLVLSVDEKTGGLTIEDTSTNGTQVKFMPDSPWDSLCEAPTGSPESPSSDGLPSLVVSYDARFASSLPSDELPSLAASHSPVAHVSGELPSLIPRDGQPVDPEASAGHVEPSHDQGELMDEMSRRVKELLEWRSRAIAFVGGKMKEMSEALQEGDGDVLNQCLNEIRREASGLAVIANTGSELLSTTPVSSVDNKTGELLRQSQEMYKRLLESLENLSTRTPADSMDLSAYSGRAEFGWSIAGLKELISGIQAVDQELIHRFNQEG